MVPARAVSVGLVLVGALSLSGCGRLASPPASGCANAIAWSEAAGSVGRRATVRGEVVAAHYAAAGEGQPALLDIGRAYPDPSRFTVVVWGRDRENFPTPPEQAYRGRTICATGFLDTALGSPEVEVTSPASISLP